MTFDAFGQGMEGPAPIEPSADVRAGAKALRETYVALIAEGFTVPEAIAIIGHCIANARGNGS